MSEVNMDMDHGDGRMNATMPFGTIADHLNENIAATVARMADATRDFSSLVQSLIDAGRELEKTMAIQRELGATSLKAVQDAQAAAEAAATSAREAKDSESASKEFTELTSKEYGSVSWLVQNLQQRIAALAVLASPLMVVAQAVEEGPASADGTQEQPDINAYRAAS